jgi:hypothetical protein
MRYVFFWGIAMIKLISTGAGAVTQLLAKSFGTVHAIDVSPSMLSTFSTEVPSDKYPNVTHSLHTLSSSSPAVFAEGEMKSPIKGDPDRVISLPRSQWDVAAVIMVLHHVDDVEGFMTGLSGLISLVDGSFCRNLPMLEMVKKSVCHRPRSAQD